MEPTVQWSQHRAAQSTQLWTIITDQLLESESTNQLLCGKEIENVFLATCLQ